MTDKKKLNAVVATFILIILALALTPVIGSSMVDSEYQHYTECLHLVPASSNTTSALTYNIRGASETYVTIMAWDNDASNATVTGYTFVAATAKTITVTGIVPTGASAGRDFWLWITYSTIDLTNAATLALVALVPLLWAVAVLAIGIVAIAYQLKHH
jgi:hypothetical protein